ncbi:MAG TPA: hypothetical protein VMU70_00995 [Candidatus Tyrphobacter sp.]|nr:hypothetical protein [Candidatus Tyrphobacter sp.]
MNLNDFFQSKLFMKITGIIGLMIVVLVSFGAGVFVGYDKAEFSFAWSKYYESNFGGERHEVMGFLSSFGFTNAHGAFGKILNASTSSLVMNDDDNTEKTILLSSSTVIHDKHNSLLPADLKPNQTILVVGSPNDQGQINARLVRVLEQEP